MMRGLFSKRNLLAAAAVLACLAGPVYAETGTLHTLAGAGLRMTIDTRWVSGCGYRPVKIDVRPIAPVPADRTLTVEFVVRRYWIGTAMEDRTVRRIEIPAGSGPIQTTLSVPDGSAWNMYHVNVLEDGELIRPLSTGGPGDPNGGAFGLVFPAILVVAGAPPDTTEMAKLFPVEAYNQYSAGIAPANSLSMPTAVARPAAELPERWIDYSSLDIVCLSLAELDDLSRRRPEAFRAIVEWAASGGNLVVYGVGRDWRRLAVLESLVGLPPGEATSEADPVARNWRLPDKNLFGKKLRGMGFDQDAAGGGYGRPYYGVVEDMAEPEVEPKPPPPVPDEPPFVVRELDQGMLVAMASQFPFPGTEHEWGWLMATLGSKRAVWYQRHGLSTIQENRDFWKFLIPGVGLVPVTGFRVLITLFVIAIGPVNYFFLRRLKRLHLLLLTTPASAAVVTALLFGYAIMADGLGTRVRVRSATHIDQRAGRAVCWSRLSYYAGLAPSRGLTFPGDVTVTPLEYVPIVSRPRRRELVWLDNQRMTSGWLASRTPTQFLTVRARPSQHGITVHEPGDGGEGTLRIENRLATPIVELLLRSKDGRYWHAADVADGAAAELRPADSAAGFNRLAQIERQVTPDCPPGMSANGPNVYSSIGVRRYYGMWGYSQANAAPTQATSRLEIAISALRPRPGAAASLEPGSYLAIVERSPEVVLGTPAAKEEGSFHLVSGTW